MRCVQPRDDLLDPASPVVVQVNYKFSLEPLDSAQELKIMEIISINNGFAGATEGQSKVS